MKYLIKALIIMTFSILCVSVASAQEKSLEEKMEGMCGKGNSTACFKVGERYRTVERDNKKACIPRDERWSHVRRGYMK